MSKLIHPNDQEAKNSLLIVNEKGNLARIKCPFWVLVLKDVDIFVVGDLTLVESVRIHTASDLIYVINDKCFNYYLFQIEEI